MGLLSKTVKFGMQFEIGPKLGQYWYINITETCNWLRNFKYVTLEIHFKLHLLNQIFKLETRFDIAPHEKMKIVS